MSVFAGKTLFSTTESIKTLRNWMVFRSFSQDTPESLID